jgi:hypothetical protein
MDLISGIVVATSVFLFTMALVTLFVRLPRSEGTARRWAEVESLTQAVMSVSLVVYFVAVVNVLLIAQQVSLALGSFVVGLALLVVFYLEPAVRTRGTRSAAVDEQDGWDK